MKTDDPVPSFEAVCDLPPAALEERRALIRREILPLVKRNRELSDGFAWEFDPSPELRAKLDEWVAFERECCGGLEWEIEAPPDDSALRLRVRGIEPHCGRLENFGGPAEHPHGARVARLLKAGGLGIGISFTVFCVVPIAVAAVLGAGIAAPLARLDDPVVVAAGAVALAIPAWLVVRRREARARLR